MPSIRRLLLLLITTASMATGAFADERRSMIPLSLNEGDYDGGRIYAPVRFGNVAGTMRLDTGASTSRITLALWNKDFPVIGHTGSMGASGKVMRCDDVEARNVLLKAAQGDSIGRAKYTLSRCPSSDGDDLLGLDFFRGTRFRLDLAHREIVFPDQKTPGADHAHPFVALGAERRLVGVNVRLGEVATTGLFDSGAEISAVDLSFIKSHGNLFTPVKSHIKASEAGGGRWAPKLFRLKEIDLGEGQSLKGIYVLGYDFGVLREALGAQTSVILGYNFLSRFQWDLDFTTPDAPKWSARLRH